MKPLRSLAAVLLSLPLLAASLRATGTIPAEVKAVFTTATTVPITAGSYTAAGNTVDLALNFEPPTGTNLTVVKNTGLAFIQGKFDNLAQGQRVTLTYGGVAYPFVADYYGGTGNDLVLQWANTRWLSWGRNEYGQLAQGHPFQANIPAPLTTAGVLVGKTILAVAAGTDHALALCADGTLAAWGANLNGQLGNTGTGDSDRPVLVDQSGILAGQRVIAIAAGNRFSLALCENGMVAAWGDNYYGQLGSGGDYPLAPRWVPTSQGALVGKTVVGVAAGAFHALALCADGTLAAWGWGNRGQMGNGTLVSSYLPVPVAMDSLLAGKTITRFGTGAYHCMVLCTDGTLATWGNNGWGELGINSRVNQAVAVAPVTNGVLNGKTIVSVAGDGTGTMAFCSDGTLATWGDNVNGNLGNGTTATYSAVPVLVNRTGVLAGKTIARADVRMALCTDGTLVAWGDNSYGQLGNNSTTHSSVPVLVNTSALGAGETVVSTVRGRDFRFAMVASPPPPPSALASTLAATGITDTGATLNGSVQANSTSTTVSFEYGLTSTYGATVAATPSPLSGAAATTVSATPGGLLSGLTYHYRVVATSAGGTVAGQDLTFTTSTLSCLSGLALSRGTLSPAFAGYQTSYHATVPNEVASITVTPMAAYDTSTIQINGVTVASGTPSGPLALTVGTTPLHTVVTAAGGGTKSYTLTFTRLPAAFTFSSATSVPVTVGDFEATGQAPAFALTYEPTVGDTLTVVSNTGPNPIRGSFDNLSQGRWVNMDYGGITYSFTANYFGGSGNDLVLQWANTRLVAWGSNSSGEVGNNTHQINTFPVATTMTGLLAGKTIHSITTGVYSSMALCADGTLAAWGNNSFGELGNGSFNPSYVPSAVDMTGVLAGKTVVTIASGYSHRLALCADGTLAAWGGNSSGQLGDNSFTDRALPVQVNQSGVLAGRTVVAIAAGFEYSLAVCTDGSVAAWGYNRYGQLGNDSTENSPVPVLVTRSGALSGRTVVAISAKGNHSLAVCADGNLATWGDSAYGQLGIGTPTVSRVPVLVSRTGVLARKKIVAAAAGTFHSLALCSDGSLAAWGRNRYGQLGNSGTVDSNVPVAVERTGALAGKTVVGISAGFYHCVALCSDGTLVAWGSNMNSQVGNNSHFDSVVPATVIIGILRPGERIVMGLGSTAVPAFFHNLALVASPPRPVATTLAATSITETGAALNATVAANSADTTVSFQYGLTTAYGNTVAATPASLSGSGTAVVGCTIGELIVGTTYHYRVVADNVNGTGYGDDMTFTASNPPVFGGYEIATPWQTAAVIPLRKLLTKTSAPDGDAFAVTTAGPASAKGGTVVLLADSIGYTPPNGFSGTDTFSVTLTESGGASTVGMVTVTVGPAPNAGGAGVNPPVLTTLSGGRMGIAFQVIPGRMYVMQRSVDGLDNWVTLATVTANAGGKVVFTDESPPAGSAFYRLGLP